jgi:hypothetical protein
VPEALGGKYWPAKLDEPTTVVLNVDGVMVQFGREDLVAVADPGLPAWVVDVLVGLVSHERLHAAGEHCLKGLLDLIPAEVIAYLAAAKGVEL